MPTPLGDRIRSLRKKHKLTLEGLATKVGSSKSYMWEIENKDVARPSAEKLSEIAIALNTTVEYLLQGEKEILPSDARDEAFFRQYKELDDKTKLRLQKMLDLLDED